MYGQEEKFSSAIPDIIANQKESCTQLANMAQDLMSAFEQKSNDVLEGLKKEADSLVALRNSESGYHSDIDKVYVDSLQAKYTYYGEMAKM